MVGRSWDSRRGWVHPGRLAPWMEPGRHQRIQPAHYMVRTDLVQTLDDLLQRRNLSLSDPIEVLLDRPIDVAYFWPLDLRGVDPVESFLRNEVAYFIHGMSSHQGLEEEMGFSHWRRQESSYGNTHFRAPDQPDPRADHPPEMNPPPWGGDPNNNHTTDDMAWNFNIGLAGGAAREGRRGAQQAYMATMLQSKMVVVVQRDAWADHYRLLEALISGALVLTDGMVSKPAGLENGTHLLEFNSFEQLHRLITYYGRLAPPAERMAMARRGRQVAMSQHRSWHRLEEMVFGRVLTTCPADGPTTGADTNVTSTTSSTYHHNMSTTFSTPESPLASIHRTCTGRSTSSCPYVVHAPPPPRNRLARTS